MAAPVLLHLPVMWGTPRHSMPARCTPLHPLHMNTPDKQVVELSTFGGGRGRGGVIDIDVVHAQGQECTSNLAVRGQVSTTAALYNGAIPNEGIPAEENTWLPMINPPSTAPTNRLNMPPQQKNTDFYGGA